MRNQLESVVSPETPMPKGYGFLKKGNAYLTAQCRRKTREAKKPLYVVMNRSNPEGLRAPKWILAQVFAEERATREKRKKAVEKKDAAAYCSFEGAVTALYPNIPASDLAAILKRTLRKKSGRVGRNGRLGLDEKARLAVQAHVRHCHTKYDQLLRSGKGKGERPGTTADKAAARRAVQADIAGILAQWGEGKGKLPRQEKRPVRVTQRDEKATTPLPRGNAGAGADMDAGRKTKKQQAGRRLAMGTLGQWTRPDRPEVRQSQGDGGSGSIRESVDGVDSDESRDGGYDGDELSYVGSDNGGTGDVVELSEDEDEAEAENDGSRPLADEEAEDSVTNDEDAAYQPNLATDMESEFGSDPELEDEEDL